MDGNWFGNAFLWIFIVGVVLGALLAVVFALSWKIGVFLVFMLGLTAFGVWLGTEL